MILWHVAVFFNFLPCSNSHFFSFFKDWEEESSLIHTSVNMVTGPFRWSVSLWWSTRISWQLLSLNGWKRKSATSGELIQRRCWTTRALSVSSRLTSLIYSIVIDLHVTLHSFIHLQILIFYFFLFWVDFVCIIMFLHS